MDSDSRLGWNPEPCSVFTVRGLAFSSQILCSKPGNRRLGYVVAGFASATVAEPWTCGFDGVLPVEIPNMNKGGSEDPVLLTVLSSGGPSLDPAGQHYSRPELRQGQTA